jgi:glycine oxidase
VGVKTWDAIVIGAGIIGLSVALELRKRGQRVLVVEKGEPGREASWAAGGMLADCPLETPAELRDFAAASARMYPEFVRELEEESGLKIDLRAVGTLLFSSEEHRWMEAAYPLLAPVSEREPALRIPGHAPVCLYLKERCVDPRGLLEAAAAVVKKIGIALVSGQPVVALEIADLKVMGVRTDKETFAAGVVVNCAGAWAGDVGPVGFPTHPVKGQMLSLAMADKNLLRHVVRTPDVYLIPRSDGRLVIGATSEEAGFDKQVVPETIENQRKAAVSVMPALADAPVMETWAGLRPGTPDKLPILGVTSIAGYFVATGHYRDGILLAPATARVMGQVIAGERPEFDLAPFAAERFARVVAS